MALERICDICHESLGVCPEKYWRLTIEELQKTNDKSYEEAHLFNGPCYRDSSSLTRDVCEDCINKIKREVSFLTRKEIEK